MSSDPQQLFETLRTRLKNAPQVQITVWDPADESFERHFMASITMVLGDRFRLGWSGALIPQGLQERFLQPGSKVGVLLDDTEPLLLFYPSVTMAPLPKQWTTESNLGFKLEFWLSLNNQLEIETIQRRKFVRIPIEVPIDILRTVASEAPRSGNTINLSAGGLRLLANEEFTVGDVVNVHLHLIPKQPPLPIKLKVVLCLEAAPVKLERRFKVSGQFVDLLPNHEAAIVRECFRRELAFAAKKSL